MFWNRKAAPGEWHGYPAMNHSVTRILCVDDDPLFQRFVGISLRHAGYEFMTALDGLEASETLERTGTETFGCVMIDRRMPRMGGLEFLDWVRARDPNLSAIVVTAEGEKEHVEKTLRAGACNFLDKPVAPEALREAVIEAVALTAQRRHLAQLRENVHRYGRYLRDTITSLPSDNNVASECFYLPKHEAGGDFLVQLRINENQHLILLTDVSGHDLWSAQWSAYFHGFLNGSLRGGASVEQALVGFNAASIERSHETENLSIAVCALLLDQEARTMTTFCCGAPAPVWVQSEQSIETIQSPAGPPLGWFADCCPVQVTAPLPAGAVYLWTDGVDELARELNASPLSVAHALLEANGSPIPPDWISASTDDLLVTRVFPRDSWRAKAGASNPIAANSIADLEPLIVDFYRPEQIGDIDGLQQYWENSLRIALPKLDHTRLLGVLLSAREAVVNALVHGCRPGEQAKFQISYRASARALSILVSDPGPGHRFSLESHRAANRDELVDAHRGLMLIESFATHTVRSRNGADLRMEFSLS